MKKLTVVKLFFFGDENHRSSVIIVGLYVVDYRCGIFCYGSMPYQAPSCTPPPKKKNRELVHFTA